MSLDAYRELVAHSAAVLSDPHDHVREQTRRMQQAAVGMLLAVIGTLIVALTYVGNEDLEGNSTNAGWKCFGAVVIGLVLATAVVASLMFPKEATEHDPVVHDPLAKRPPDPVYAPIEPDTPDGPGEVR